MARERHKGPKTQLPLGDAALGIRIRRVRQVQQHEAGGGGRDEAGDRGGREGVDAFEVHGRVGELGLVDEVEGGVDQVGAQVEGLGVEARGGVAAGFGGAEGEFEEGLVPRGDDGEVVGHFWGWGRGGGRSD